MSDPFNGYLYLKHIRSRWKVVGGALATAAIVSLGAALLSPNRYTATVSLVIEPPAGGDPRAATAVSQVYLESLKTYEHYASSDELFARAVERFALRREVRKEPIEKLKQDVLRVSVQRNTKIMEISATCREPGLAHAVALYLAQETLLLNRNASQARRDELLTETFRAKDAASADLRAAEAEYQRISRKMPTPAAIQDDLTRLATKQDGLSRVALSLEFARDDADDRTTQLQEQMKLQVAGIEAQAAAKQTQLAARTTEIEAVKAKLDEARSAFEHADARVREADTLSSLQGERLEILDPGVVPERRSSPNIPLNIVVGLAVGALLSFLYLTFDYGLTEQRRRAAREEEWTSSRG